MEIETDYEAVETKHQEPSTRHQAPGTKNQEPGTTNQAPRIMWVAPTVPAYLCRCCGAVLPKPRAGERCLEIYCDDCAKAILARRERHAKRQARCRVRRVHTGTNPITGERTWIEYRGTFSPGIFAGREVEEMENAE